MIFLSYYVIEEIIDLTLSHWRFYETLSSSPISSCLPVSTYRTRSMGQTGTCGLIYILESKSYLLRQPLFPLGPRIRTHRITDPRWPALFFHSTNRDNGNYLMKITGFAPLSHLLIAPHSPRRHCIVDVTNPTIARSCERL